FGAAAGGTHIHRHDGPPDGQERARRPHRGLPAVPPSPVGGTIVKAAPTFKPQLITSKMRLERVLAHMPGKIPRAVRSRFGYIIQLDEAAVQFLSAEESSNVVGATADLLLEIDEAQDVSEEKYLKDFRPMASTANTTAVLYGTAWSRDTMLARQ